MIDYLVRWARWRLRRPQLDPFSTYPTRRARWLTARPQRNPRWP